MRLQILSDFHFDVMQATPPSLADGVDLVVAAGDICEGIARGLAWLRRHLGARVPIVFVAGNHEYFRRSIRPEAVAGMEMARSLGIAFLDDAEIILGGVRVVGSTLWADFDLYGAARRLEAMDLARDFMIDHRRIVGHDGHSFQPEDARRQHLASRAFIEDRLRVPFAGPTVVVTHHGPHPLSLAPQFADDLLSSAFISDLSALIELHQPALWVHGHTHASFDYRVGATRIVCNPHGYGPENPAYDPALVVEV